MAFRSSKIILIALQFAAFWSVGRWYFLRFSTSNDDFYGVLALIAIAAMCFKFPKAETPVSNFNLIIAAIIIYAGSFFFLPPLLRAIIAVTSLTFAVSSWKFGKRFHFGIWILFLLSLPVVASMQFYLGFPLRLIVGEATSVLLKLNGLQVFREGVCLHFGEQLVWIDAPCSGIKMLWAGFFLASLLVTFYKFPPLKSVAAFCAAFGIIIFGNVFRAAGLFYLETGIVKLPAHAHEAIGVSAFILTCIAIAAAVLKLKNPSDCAPKFRSAAKSKADFTNGFQFAVFVTVCISAFAAPLIFGGKENYSNKQSTVVFPTVFEDKMLTPLELSERERFFLNDFPGEIKRYTDGNREIIIRSVTEATRKLHPASDCFAAIGYQIRFLPLKIDENQNKWACFAAVKANQNYNVCERIYTDGGESWTDVSSWYWSAFSRENQNYWAVTIAESSN